MLAKNIPALVVLMEKGLGGDLGFTAEHSYSNGLLVAMKTNRGGAQDHGKE